MRIASTKLLLALAVLVGVASAWYAHALELSQFVSDDGGITLRYAERIAHGQGFNYNDGEHVNGASCTLYTLILAGLLRLGLAPAAAITHFAVACFGATMALLWASFARHWSLFAAVFALAACCASQILFHFLFDALEPTLVMLLAAALFHALHTRSAVYQGIVLGLLVASKLDGALAALAFALVSLFGSRSSAWKQDLAALCKVALVAFLTALPVFIVLLACFGTIFPQSALTKLFPVDVPPRSPFDPLWISRDLARWLPQFIAPALLSFLIADDRERRLPQYTIGVWCVLVVLAYSTIDLGAPYPWYETLPAFLIVILATITAHTLLVISRERAPAGRGARLAACTLLALYFTLHDLPQIRARMQEPRSADNLLPSSARELARLASGAWLRKHTSGTELLATAQGLPAFEYKGPVYDLGLLNSRRDPAALARARYLVHGPFGSDELPPWNATADPRGGGEELRLAATFQFGADADLFAVYASADSEIARAGACHLRAALLASPPLDATTLEPVAAGRVFIKKRELLARVPSGLLLDVRSPCPPTFSVTPAVRSGPQRHDPGVRMRIRINGEELYARELETGADAAPLSLRASVPAPDGTYRLELDASADAADVQGVWAHWGNLDARTGDALVPADFSLMCAPWARRIESVEAPSQR